MDQDTAMRIAVALENIANALQQMATGENRDLGY